jgi:Xaa-Pro aminopeptidase
MSDAGSVNAPISTSELERRWIAIRSAMAEANVDVLLFQGNNDFMGGYVKYVTDLPASNGYPVTVIFSIEGEVTLIRQGGFGADQKTVLAEGSLPVRVLGTPSYASAFYTLAYDAELAAGVLKSSPYRTVGLVGRGSLPVSLMEGMRQAGLENLKFVDVSDSIDQIKCIKSAEEVHAIRRTAEMQDAAMNLVPSLLVPGVREIDIVAAVEKFCVEQGSEQGIYLACSYKPGDPTRFQNRHAQRRTINKGDIFTLLIECNGPGGFYTELGRTFVLGHPSSLILDEHEFLLEARKFTLGMLKCGATCADIWHSYNRFLRDYGRPEERRLHCHSQGYDMVERPLVRLDEPMRIRENLSMACHPTFMTSEFFNTVCDNFLIDSRGELTRIHRYPEVVVGLS